MRERSRKIAPVHVRHVHLERAAEPVEPEHERVRAATDSLLSDPDLLARLLQAHIERDPQELERHGYFSTRPGQIGIHSGSHRTTVPSSPTCAVTCQNPVAGCEPIFFPSPVWP